MSKELKFTATESIAVLIVRKEANYRCPYVERQYTYIWLIVAHYEFLRDLFLLVGYRDEVGLNYNSYLRYTATEKVVAVIVVRA